MVTGLVANTCLRALLCSACLCCSLHEVSASDIMTTCPSGACAAPQTLRGNSMLQVASSPLLQHKFYNGLVSKKKLLQSKTSILNPQLPETLGRRSVPDVFLREELKEELECIKCPSCLQHLHGDCLNRQTDYVRSHKDCKSGAVLCSRGVWECPGTGFFFTVPTVTPTEIVELYSTNYSGQAKIPGAQSSRIVGQYEFIQKHILSNSNVKPRNLKTIVEVGCAAGFLSSKLAAPDRHMVCFEPDPDFADVARAHLSTAGFASVEVINGPWDREKIPADGIDLFLSSHVLEHMPDMCSFLAELQSKLNPGAAIFTEIPNHTRDYIASEFGGQFHLSFPTEQGFLNIMKANSFELVSMDLFPAYGDEINTKGGGAHVRSVFIKPSKYEHGGLGWTPGGGGK